MILDSLDKSKAEPKCTASATVALVECCMGTLD